MLSVHGSIKEADYVAAQWLHIKPRPVFAVGGSLLLLLFLAVLIVAPNWELPLGLAVVASTLFIYTPYKARQAFRQYKALAEPVSIEVRDDGLFFKRTTGEGLVPWSHVMKWRHNRKLLLLYPTTHLFYLIPAHFFESSAAFMNFASLIETKIGRST